MRKKRLCVYEANHSASSYVLCFLMSSVSISSQRSSKPSQLTANPLLLAPHTSQLCFMLTVFFFAVVCSRAGKLVYAETS